MRKGEAKGTTACHPLLHKISVAEGYFMKNKSPTVELFQRNFSKRQFTVSKLQNFGYESFNQLLSFMNSFMDFRECIYIQKGNLLSL